MNARFSKFPHGVTVVLLVSSCLLCLNSCAGPGTNVPASVEGIEPIQLPPPQTELGRPLMQVLVDRKSMRLFKDDKISLQDLSNLLWAAFGVNRPESGKRTAPSAMNWQEIDIYAATQEGLYLYDAKENLLKPILAKDIRAKTGRFIQPFVKKAPLNLVFVADFSRVSLMGKVVPEEEKLIYAAFAAGCISQNVYLYCASQGLGTVVRGLVDKEELAEAMGLREDQKIILAQTVGYPRE